MRRRIRIVKMRRRIGVRSSMFEEAARVRIFRIWLLRFFNGFFIFFFLFWFSFFLVLFVFGFFLDF